MLTAAVRDLHIAYPQQFETDVRSSADDLWKHNPYLTPLRESDNGVEVLDMHYPLIHESNTRPLHFIHGYPDFLERRLSLRIPVTRFCGDIHLTDDEKIRPPDHLGLAEGQRFWIIVAGGKYDFTAKWWNPASYQAVVDHFRGKIQFVQCGEAGHWHPQLQGVINCIGKTTTRQFVRLMHHADGVVCPVTFAMHLAAAVEAKVGQPKHRPCVVVAGGREPMHWEAYPHHQYLNTNGALSCCQDGGCWKSRCQLVGDGDPKDRLDVCEQPVQITPELRIPKCLDMISAEDVIRRIELYYQGGALQFADSYPPQNNNGMVKSQLKPRPAMASQRGPEHSVLSTDNVIRVKFHHGLGDCAYFAHLIRLYLQRGYQIEVECTPDKRIIFEAAGARVLEHGADVSHAWGYPSGGTHEGHGRFWQGSKIGNNISAAPLPDIGEKSELWDELCRSHIDIRPHLTMECLNTARRWLERLPRPVVLLHQKGNTAQQRKSLSDAVAEAFYRKFLDQCDGTLILLDWDERVPRLASFRIRHLSDFGPCPVELLLALMTEADLMIGVDSGPLHMSRFTNIPTLGIWQPGHYPSTYTLPRNEQLNVVLSEHTRQWNRYKRIPWNIVEHPRATFNAETLIELTGQMLSKPRYLSVPARNSGAFATTPTIAQDVQLQQFVREFCRCRGSSGLAEYWDRQRSLDVLFREMASRFRQPIVVETGTIRAEEDFGGAGFFTYLAGTFLHRHGGTLHSVDLTPQHVTFAREWTAVFGDAVNVYEGDAIEFLARFSSPIDVLYLDSLDTTQSGHAEHCQKELEAALPKLHNNSLICIDDTPWRSGAFIGKGATVVPWLLNNGWYILYAGYQVVLARLQA